MSLSMEQCEMCLERDAVVFAAMWKTRPDGTESVAVAHMCLTCF